MHSTWEKREGGAFRRGILATLGALAVVARPVHSQDAAPVSGLGGTGFLPADTLEAVPDTLRVASGEASWAGALAVLATTLLLLLVFHRRSS